MKAGDVIMSLLPERLRHLRKSFNFTQQKVADYLQISRKMLSNYECGIREPNIDMLHSLALYYFVSIDYLVGASNVENTQYCPGFVADLINDSKYLSEESIKDLEKYVELLKIRDEVKKQNNKK